MRPKRYNKVWTFKRRRMVNKQRVIEGHFLGRQWCGERHGDNHIINGGQQRNFSILHSNW